MQIANNVGGKTVKVRFRMFENFPKAHRQVNPPAEATVNASAKFAPEVKLALASPESANPCAIDFDTGKTRAADIKLVEMRNGYRGLILKVDDWLAPWGGDLIPFAQNPGKALFGVRCLDMTLCHCTPEAWNNLTAQEVLAIVSRREPEHEGLVNFYDYPVYAFKTRQGTVGLLEILPGDASPQTLNIRYKVILPK